MPCIAYQSIEEREFYLLKYRLMGVRIRTELLQEKTDKVNQFWQKLQNTPILNESWINETYYAFKQLCIVKYFTYEKLVSKIIPKTWWKNSIQHIRDFLLCRFLSQNFWFLSVFSEKLPDKVGKIGISMWSAEENVLIKFLMQFQNLWKNYKVLAHYCLKVDFERKIFQHFFFKNLWEFFSHFLLWVFILKIKKE